MDLLKKLKFEVHPYIFYPATGVIALFLIFGIFWPDGTERVFGLIQDFIVTYFGWLYILSVAFFLIFVIVLYFSPFGHIKLGPDDSEPDYSYGSWFAMLFSAGMGIGLVFFSVAEPIFHFQDPPMLGEGGTLAAAKESMRFTFFHWGVHAWSIYIIVAMSLAYFAFRHQLPLSIRSAFYPLFGERIYGGIGHTIDILAIFGTLFGVATSLGLGVMQVNSGMNFLFGIEESTTVQILLIASITFVATISVVLGLDKGIRRLSNFNMVVALGLILFVFLLGPSLFVLNSLVENTGYYLQNLVETTFWMDTLNDTGWQAGWTLFYWGWWIAWSPFVGMFIARVSRGRTIREFITGVLLVPTALTFIWLSVFGSSAIYVELFGEGGIAGMETPQMLFALLDGYPLSALTTLAASAVVITFFVTSSDSGSLVIDILASGGNPDPPVGTRVFWATTEGAVAAVLLLTGGLTALETAAITTGLPFTLVLLLMCYSLYTALAKEQRELHKVKRRYTAKKVES